MPGVDVIGTGPLVPGRTIVLSRQGRKMKFLYGYGNAVDGRFIRVQALDDLDCTPIWPWEWAILPGQQIPMGF